MSTENFVRFSLHSYLNEAVLNIPGWAKYMDSSKHQYINNGYYGIAFINRVTKEVVITSRGTGEGSSDLKYSLDDLKRLNFEDLMNDIYKDYDILSGKLPSTFIDQELHFAELAIRSLENFRDYKFYFTGHSYGAIVAEVSHFMLSKSLNIHSEAITFDSPGSAPMIAALEPKTKFPLPDITIYNAQPNIVNTCNKQAGRTFLIKNTNEYIEIPKKFDINSAAVSFLEFLKLTSSRHNLEEMLLAISPSTGKFSFEKEIKNWPILAENLRSNIQKSYAAMEEAKTLPSQFIDSSTNFWDCLSNKLDGNNLCLDELRDFSKHTVNIAKNINKISEVADKVIDTVGEAISYLGIYKLDYTHDEL